MFNLNVLYAIGILAGVIIFRRFVMPYLRKNNIELYEEVKIALLIMGYSFRDDKIKNITNVALELVKDLEKIAIAPEDKLEVAIEEVSKKLMNDFGIDLDEEVLKVIIRVAVSTLAPTNPQIN